MTETGNLTANLNFLYLDSDVNGNESDYRVYKRENRLITNLCPGAPCVNTATNTLSGSGISDFSRWTGAQLFAPSAAAVNVGGRVVTSTGRGIAGARVYLIDNDGTVIIRQTNSSGYYRFKEVSAGQTYTLTVTDKLYKFAQSSQVLFVGDENLDVNFISNELNLHRPDSQTNDSLEENQ